MIRFKETLSSFSLITLLLLSSCKNDKKEVEDYTGWQNYAGTKDGSRYSSLTEITPENVAGLTVAWKFSTGDKDTGKGSQIQCNPIIVNNILYGTSPKLRLFAVDAATGAQKWMFDPFKNEQDRDLIMGVNRGLTFWQNDNGEEKRILYGVKDKLYAVDANTGQLISSFGQNGFIDLDEGLDRETVDASVSLNTPGIVYKDLIIMGGRVSETAEAAPGHIRAFDVRTGKRKWIFHTIPQPGEPGYDTWQDTASYKKVGGANNWSGMSLDEKRGIVYIPLGSAAYDFYGGNRKGQNLYANSLLALDAATGKYIWHYQTVHHDIWDRDLPANPNLLTINHNGKQIDAVAQIAKSGFVFMFDRTNGKPIFPINEVPIPTSDLPGEEVWPTQPIPTLPEPFARQSFKEEDVANISPESHEEMLKLFKASKGGHLFTAPSKQGTIIFPGFDGGGEWGGAAVDQKTGIMYVNANEMPWILTMIDVPKNTEDHSMKGIGKSVYTKYCITCHGADLKGDASGAFPSLLNLNKKYKEDEVRTILATGRGRMPAFRQMPEAEKNALIAFLLNKEEKEMTAVAQTAVAKEAVAEVPYTSTGYNRMLDKNGYPGIKPPWGTLNAIDLNTGKILWKSVLGEFEELTKKGIPQTGTENYGGPLVTAGGLVFIAGTKDSKIRAFNKNTGKVVWETKLPTAAFATPATYSVNGKQYVVIACGGGRGTHPSGDEYVAFALP